GDGGHISGAAPDASQLRPRVHYRLVTDADGVAALAERIRGRAGVTVGVSISEPDPMRGRLMGLALRLRAGDGSYLPFRHRAPREELELELEERPDDSVPNLPLLSSDVLTPLRAVLEDAAIPKSGHNLKVARIALQQEGSNLAGLDFDTMVAS